LKLIVVVLAFLSFSLSAERLKFVAENLPPYHYKDQNGQIAGALVDVVNAVAKQANVEYDIELYPFARAFSMLQNKSNVLMFSLLNSPSRQKQFIWLGNTFHNAAFLVSVKNSKIPLTELKQAQKYSVGTIRGYYSETYLRNAGFEENKNLALSVNYQNLWHMLFKGRIDFVLTNTVSLNSELNQLGHDVRDIERTLELTDFPSQLHLAANQNLSPTIAAALKNGLEIIKQIGEYQSILDKWHLHQ
jgi:polar amino acid transport system substrate-binding protein